jgi:hypothetical protein
MEITMKLYKNLSTTLAVILACTLTFALPALSYGVEGFIGDGSDKATQTITYSWLSEDALPEIPNTVKTDEDGTWNLIDTTEPRINADYERPYQDYEQTLSVVVKADADYKSLFEQSIVVDEQYLKGEITLDTFKVAPGYNSNTAQVERTKIFKNVSDQELDEIPQTYKFKVKSDSAPGAKAKVALNLSESDYKVTKYDEAGKAVKYTVMADYRGQESYLTHTYDTVYATYKGRVSDVRDQWLIEATYEYAPATPTLAQLPDNLVPQAAPFAPIVIAEAAMLIIFIALGLFWLLWLRRNARLVITDASYLYSDIRKGKTVKRQYAKFIDGEAHFIVPDSVNLFDQEHNYSIELAPSLANRYGILKVIWRNRTVAQAELNAVIDLHISRAVYAAAKIVTNDLIISEAIQI